MHKISKIHPREVLTMSVQHFTIGQSTTCRPKTSYFLRDLIWYSKCRFCSTHEKCDGRCTLILQATFDVAMRQKQASEDDAIATKKKMDDANSLLGALAGEEARWTEQSNAFDDQIQRLTGSYTSYVHFYVPLPCTGKRHNHCVNNVHIMQNLESVSKVSKQAFLV